MTGKKTITQITGWFLSLIFCVSMTSMTVYAAQGQVTLEMDQTTIRVGTSTTLNLVLTDMGSEVKLERFDGLDSFEVSNTGQSRSTSIVNGVSTNSLTVSYTIQAKEMGEYKLQAVLSQGGDLYESNVLEVEVVEADAGLEEVESDIFVRTNVSKETAYFGEEIVVSYELYSRYQVDNFGFTEGLDLDGFLINQDIDSNFSPSYLEIGGNQYVMYTARQLVLTPTTTGPLTLPSFSFQANLSTGGFFGSTRATYLDTQARTIDILPIPSEGQPASFEGLIGDYDVTTNYSRQEVQGNEPITLEVTISGTGNLATLGDLEDLMDLEDFSVYESSSMPEGSVSNEGHQVSKTYELILVAKSPGDYEIASTSIAYFNTRTGDYDQLELPSQEIQVLGTANQQPVDGSTTQVASATPMLISQVSYEGDKEEGVWLSLGREEVLAGLGLLLFLFLAWMVWQQMNQRSLSERQERRRFLKKIKAIKEEAELKELLNAYLVHQYGVSIYAHAIEELVKQVKSPDQAKALEQLLYELNDSHQSGDLEAQKAQLRQLVVADNQ